MGMKVILSNRAYASITAETMEKIKTETGGLFLGKKLEDTWYIVEAIDPGPRAIFQTTYFEYDREYTQHLINKVNNLYASNLSLIGLWHRHPGSMDYFSSTDDLTNQHYATLSPHGAISALVNIDPNFRLTFYHVSYPHSYSKINYQVGDDLFPKNLLDYNLDRFNLALNQGLERSVSLEKVINKLEKNLKPLEGSISSSDISDEEIRRIISDELLTDLIFLADELGIKYSIIQQKNYICLVQDSIEKVTKLIFAYNEGNDELFFQWNRKKYCYEEGLFQKLVKKELRNQNERDISEIQDTDKKEENKSHVNKFLLNKLRRK